MIKNDKLGGLWMRISTIKKELLKKDILLKVLFLLLIFILFLPFISIVKDGGQFSINKIINQRRFRVILKTLSFSLLVSLFVTFISLFLSTIAYLYKKIVFPMFIILIFFMAIPPYIHSLAWIEFSSVFLDKSILSGGIISIFVQVLYFLPFGSLICYLGILSIDEAYFNVSRLELAPIKAAFFTIINLSAAPIIMSFSTIFLLSLNDYTIPSIFAFNTYPIEIMTVFSSSTELIDSIYVTIPFLIISVIGAFVVYYAFKNYYSSLEELYGINYPKIRNNYFLIIAFLIIIIIQGLIPIIMLLIDGGNLYEFLNTIVKSKEELIFSFSSVFISSLFILIFSYIFSYFAFIWNKVRAFLFFIFAFLLGIPGSIIGISILNIYNNNIFDGIYYSPILTSHVLFLRFLPIGFFIVYGTFSRFDRNYLDEIRLNTNNHRIIISKILIPSTIPAMISSFFIVFILGFGELSGTIMVVPPGSSTVTIKIYNYLHYGSTDEVKSLCLFVLILSLALATIIFIIFSIYNRNNGRGGYN